jgi:hypothetical protein
MVVGKPCFIGGGVNICNNSRLIENIVWENMDDGYDVSMNDSWMISNVAIDNGPAGGRGIKVLGAGRGQIFSGNLSIGRGLQYRGYELRGLDTMDIFHNFALTNLDRGVYLVSLLPAARMHNNLGRGNRGDVGCAGCVKSHNWGTPSGPTGDPRLADIGATLDLAIDHALPSGSVEQRWQYVMDQILAAYSLRADSPLIDAGLVIAGFHCATADDDPTRAMNPCAVCRHWMGAAPDIGPFEYGLGLSHGQEDRC